MIDVKRKLAELIAMYTLEESLIDIYLEGTTDKMVIENFFEYKGVKKYCVEIDTIEIYSQQPRFPDLDLSSHKDKLIALSRILDENQIQASVMCVADKDFDGLMRPLETNKHLLYTDYSCLESYFFTNAYIKKLTTLGIRNFPYEPAVILKQIGPVLQALFTMRMINKQFGLDLEFPRLDNNIKVNKGDGSCGFDFESYLELYINVNKLRDIKQSILDFVRDISKKFAGDVRLTMNKYDFIEALFLYINKIKNPANFTLKNFTHTIYVAIQPDHFETYPLFVALAS